MANSKYWKDLRNSENNKIKKYNNQIKDLEKIYTSLTEKLNDEIRNVNSKIDDLASELSTAVRHNSVFSRQANQLEHEKEKATTADSMLKTAASNISEELSDLKKKKKACEDKYNDYDKKYQEAKKDESLIKQIFG